MRKRTISVFTDNHRGEHIAFELNGTAYAHTFRGDHDLAKGMTELRDRIATGLKSPPYSVGLDSVTMRFGDNEVTGMRLTFVSSWDGWPVYLGDVEATESLEVAVDAPEGTVASA